MQNYYKELDLSHIWHPCTQMHDHEKNIPLIPIMRGEGIKLYDFDGNSYIDCVSSWWVNLFGHCNPYINQKLKEQIDSLEHIIFAGFSHKPIITLSNRLIKLLNSNLEKIFYADNGSSAIEVALKMAFHASKIKEKNLNNAKFLCLKNAYHGETIGALSVGDVGIYTEIYKPLLLETLTIKAPQGKDYEKSLQELESALKSHQIIAFILEPLIQCAGNMNMYDKDFVRIATNLCRKYGVYVIFDEIAVGFGRTGSMFAHEQCGVTPDFLCLSKGITGGYLPLSCVVTTNEIYNLFYAPFSENKAFLHSHSYTGNPLACACANAVLDIFEQENVIEKNKGLSTFIWQNLKELESYSFVANLRHIGMVFAFDLVGFEGQRKGLEVFNKALKKGLLLRPLGNTIYLMPPYIIDEATILYIIKSLKEIFDTFSAKQTQ